MAAVTFKYANGSEITYNTNGNGSLKDYKVVTLTNSGSASTSEIVAGALRDYDKTTIVGETSFGKGSVQSLSVYDDDSMFKLTVSKWFTPNDISVDGVGLTPDKVVVNTDTGDKQLDAALDEF